MTFVRRDHRTLWVPGALVLVAGWVPAVPAQAAEKLHFNRDVRPILAENCFACHGPDGAARKADLRLDRRDHAIEAEAITPGKPDKSEAIARVFLADDEDGLMPPKKSHKKLTSAQKEVLKRWVAEGAEYLPHWSFITPTRPAAPAVKDQAWVRSPIDAFVLAELEKRGLKPAPEADRRTLARRASLDLTGLPPKPDDVDAFVADESPNAYERYVDKLLASPHWGEHRGRYWLDAARYADTHGIHFDNFREMWSYRDWVINSFNRNQPFDRFTTEQLAGDLLPDATLDQKIATGFNRCNITTNEGGAIDEEYLVLYARDRTETASQVWMGLTAGCAVCHDHKYDPISQKDFYGMSAFFNNTTQRAMDGNIKDTPPIIPVPQPEDRAEWASIEKKLASTRAALDARKSEAMPAYERWLTTATPASATAARPDDGLTYFAWLDEGAGTSFRSIRDGKPSEHPLPEGAEWRAGPLSANAAFVKKGAPVRVPEAGDFDTRQPFSFGAWVQIPQRNQKGGVIARMDIPGGHRGWDLYLDGDRFAVHLINRWPDDALRVACKTPVDATKWVHVFATVDGSGTGAGVRIFVNGEPQPLEVTHDTLKGTTRTSAPLTVGQRTGGDELRLVGVQDLRIYDRTLSAEEVARLVGTARAVNVLGKPGDKRTPAEKEMLFGWWLSAFDVPAQEITATLGKIRERETAIRARGTIAHVMSENTKPAEAFVLARGEYDKRKDKLGPLTPAALPHFPDDLPRNRLGFAAWLLRDDHPLTARVTVNRFWQEVFGTGLVRTTGDFGISGEQPSHPELLDWLSVEFREGGWDVKKFFKLLVTSSAYRQSAAVTPEKLEKDRDNRLMSRGPRFRMDAEMVRDYALAASGLLVEKVGGPSVKTYQPNGVWEAVAMPGSNTRNYKRDAGESLYRRSLYTFWKRSAPPAFLDVMNAPNRETCVVRRDRTNTPLQALLTLNDVQYVEAARVLAEKTLGDGGETDDARLEFVAKRLLTRPFRSEEQAVVKASLAELTANYEAKPGDAKKLIGYGESKADPKLDPAALAAWTMLVNEVMNLDEVLNK